MSLPIESQNVFDPSETLTYAAHTDRITLGTSVIDMLFHNPVILARRFVTLDVLSEEEVFALGIGWSKDEYQVSNIPFKAGEFIQTLNFGTEHIYQTAICVHFLIMPVLSLPPTIEAFP